MEPIIVAIELGTFRISGIAGKKKDGNLQVLAYAEEMSAGCVKRGIVYNIEKTTQCIRNIIAKLEEALKLKISQIYVSVGGQSVRSVKMKVRRNLMTQTCITAEHVCSMQDESSVVSIPDCELIENFPQGYVVDGISVADPQGIMGTNIEGEYLNVIARTKLKANIQNCFENVGMQIAEVKLAAYQLAESLLTDQEKRAGSVLVDLGAGTTTVVVYKNNILRYLVTLPLGMANITQDLTTLQVDEKEAEKLKLTYGNACIDADEEPIQPSTYTTSLGHTLQVSEIQHYINARLMEILENVVNQIENSGFASQLLGGVVITGGGSKMKNIDKAFTRLKLEKVRIAHEVNDQVVKNSNVTHLNLNSSEALSAVSLLMSGTESCVVEMHVSSDNVDNKDVNQEQHAADVEKIQLQRKQEQNASYDLERYKTALRNEISEIEGHSAYLSKHLKDKAAKKKAEELVANAGLVLDDGYHRCVEILEPVSSYKQALREAADLKGRLDKSVDDLKNTITLARSANNIFNRAKRFLDELINE